MRALAIFLLLVIVSLILSALINHPLYLLLQGLTDAGPHKLINTTAKLIAVPLFILIVRAYGIANRQGLGYGVRRPLFLSELLKGWLAGVAILALLAGALLLLGVRVPLAAVPQALGGVLLKALLAGLIGGLLIGFIEETFFRGGLFGAIRKNGGFASALLLSSLLYAAMHFIKPRSLGPGVPSDWGNGLLILSGAFEQLGQWSSLDSFLALFMVGAFLALVRERSGNIAYCIGLHAGWVFVIKLTRKFTTLDPQAANAYLVGGYDGITGYLACGWLLLLWLLFHRYWRNERRADGALV